MTFDEATQTLMQELSDTSNGSGPWTRPQLEAPPVKGLVEQLKECSILLKQLEERKKGLIKRIDERFAEGDLSEFEDMEPGRYVFEELGVTLVRRTRQTWQHTEAIKKAKEAEIAEGIATRKVSEYWATDIAA